MDLQIHGHNLEITAKTRELVENKFRKLNRHLPGITDASADLAFDATRSNNDRFVAQMTLRVGKSLLRAHRSAANTKVAVNSVAPGHWTNRSPATRAERTEMHAAVWSAARLGGGVIRHSVIHGPDKRRQACDDKIGRRMGESLARQSR